MVEAAEIWAMICLLPRHITITATLDRDSNTEDRQDRESLTIVTITMIAISTMHLRSSRVEAAMDTIAAVEVAACEEPAPCEVVACAAVAAAENSASLRCAAEMTSTWRRSHADTMAERMTISSEMAEVAAADATTTPTATIRQTPPDTAAEEE